MITPIGHLRAFCETVASPEIKELFPYQKKLAARLRELKKKGMTDESAKRLADLFEHPDFSGEV